MSEPLEVMNRAQLQLNIMRNIEIMITTRLSKNSSLRNWWDNSNNTLRVQRFINANTSKAGSNSSRKQCVYMGADPDGYTFL